ncbi:MAG: ACP S-malonyltransferase [Deferribacteraceae bacterium]|jgi:[acyl-carrier-protein] S-malonyltransferase|nr:ACP S-malonyltransferase [Deferribacteraceae bacterium]
MKAVIFPGQGSQSVGMGKDIYDLAKDTIDAGNSALGFSLSKIMFEGPEEDLRSTKYTQPALLLHSIALWRLIADKVKPAYFAGHSLGEYTALTAAGGISLEEALKAVHNRGKFMQEAVPMGVGGMLAVLGSTDADVEAVCREVSTADSIIEPANYNSDGQIVVAGHLSSVDRFTEAMKAKGAKRVVPLPVSAPFHCSLMMPAQLKMASYLDNMTFNTLHTPVVNNVDAVVETAPDVVKDALVRQMSGAVRWTQVVKTLIGLGVTEFIEVGAGSVLSGLIKKIDKNISCVNISSKEDLEKII